MNQWHRQLAKPFWAPPARIFGPVWTVLYLVIVFTFGSAALMFAKSQISWFVILPFLLNIVFNICILQLYRISRPYQFRSWNNIWRYTGKMA